MRRVVGNWSNCSVEGKPLLIRELNGELAMIRAFRGTICDLKPHMLEYLLRRINEVQSPRIQAAQQAKESLELNLRDIITQFHWRDFELLVDLIFSHSGWQRVSVVGETMKTIDIELRLPVTGERAMVQIKSKTTQAEFEEYLTAFNQLGIDRLFYVYHTAKVPITLRAQDPRVTLIGPDHLASLVLRAGLVEWVMEKAG